MRWPWQRPETRSAGGGTFFDEVLSQIEAQAATRAASVGATAALEAASGALSRALMCAGVQGPLWAAEALSPPVLGQMGRDLMRGGASLWRIDTTKGAVRLRPAAQWFWTDARSADPHAWRVRATEFGPSGSVVHLLPFDAVVWLAWGSSTSTPWVGQGPAEWAALTAKLSAEAERTLGDEAAGPIAQILPVPQDPSDGGDIDGEGDNLAQLRADVAKARGRGLLVETTTAGWGEGQSRAPRKDWVAERLGPNPPAAVVEAARDGYARMLSACGCPPALFDARADGTSQRESLRRWHQGTVVPLARMVEWELSAKLEAPIKLAFDNYPQDLQGRASAFKAMVTAGADVTDALAVTGLLADES